MQLCLSQPVPYCTSTLLQLLKSIGNCEFWLIQNQGPKPIGKNVSQLLHSILETSFKQINYVGLRICLPRKCVK